MSQNEKEINNDVLEKLKSLEQAVEQINKNRKWISIINIAGVLIILAVIAVSVNSMYKFFNNYNTIELADNLQKNIPIIAQSRSANELYTTVEKLLIPKYTDALVKSLKENAPLIAEDVFNEQEKLCSYLENDFKARLTKNIIKQLSNSESQHLAEYVRLKLTPEKIEELSETLQVVLDRKLTKDVDEILTPAMNQIADINECFEVLYSNMVLEGEFEGITPETIGEVENRFIEALIESLMYEINPQKGNEKSTLN